MNPWHNVRLLDTIANAMLALVALAVLTGSVWWLAHRPMFTLRAVVVEAAPGHSLRHVDAVPLRALGLRRLQGNFFTVDLSQVRANIEQVPWVRRASVRRVWPNGLLVAIEEHKPFAAWGDGRFLNPHGELFAVNEEEAEEDGPLPQLSGPPDSEREVLRKWRELAELLAPLGAKPRALALSPRQAWSAELDNGMSLTLGRDQGLPTRERVERFVRAWPELSARVGVQPASVDLRYPNGFAIRLAEASASAGAASSGAAKGAATARTRTQQKPARAQAQPPARASAAAGKGRAQNDKKQQR